MHIWQVATRKALKALDTGSAKVIAVAFANDGTTIAAADSDGFVRLWDATTHTALKVLEAHPRGVRACMDCVFSQDGNSLAMVAGQGSLWCSNTRSGELYKVFTGHEGKINACAFSHDGLRLASVGVDGTLRLWNLDSDVKPLVRTHLHAGSASAAWTPDGQLLHAAGRAWRYLAHQRPGENDVQQSTPIGECAPWGIGSAFEHNPPI